MKSEVLQIAGNGSEIHRAGSYSVIYLQDPERTLETVQQVSLSEILQPVASRGFGREVTAESLRNHALTGQNHLLLVLKEGETFVGFAAARNFESALTVFLTGVVLSPEHQGRGLGGKVFRALLEVVRCQMLALTTQSPVVYHILLKLSEVVYPSLDELPIPLDLRNLGARLMENRDGRFCRETFVSKGLYSQGLYEKFPWCTEPRVNAFFRRMLDFDGSETRDGFLLIGEMR